MFPAAVVLDWWRSTTAEGLCKGWSARPQQLCRRTALEVALRANLGFVSLFVSFRNFAVIQSIWSVSSSFGNWTCLNFYEIGIPLNKIDKNMKANQLIATTKLFHAVSLLSNANLHINWSEAIGFGNWSANSPIHILPLHSIFVCSHTFNVIFDRSLSFTSCL